MLLDRPVAKYIKLAICYRTKINFIGKLKNNVLQSENYNGLSRFLGVIPYDLVFTGIWNVILDVTTST